MTRIIAGAAGGRRLLTPQGDLTRPTSDRVREAVFSTLAARGLLDGTAVLDLFCGSGALGLEAVSRGARSALLVDQAREAVAVARRNVAALGLPGVSVVQQPVARFVAAPAPTAHDLVLLDPPYAYPEADLAGVLGALLAQGWLAPDALVVVERSTRSPEPAWPGGLEALGVRRYGETAVWTAEPADPGPAPDPDPGTSASAHSSDTRSS